MDAAWQRIETGLHSRSGLVRKGCAWLLRGPRRSARATATAEDYRLAPPALANSFPKSGTHLLDQIVAELPRRRNYGTFVAELTSSFQMKKRSLAETLAAVGRCAPGEVVRAHLHHSPELVAALDELNFARYFIFRDPRDVVLSSCHYLREMNRWHRLHAYFKRCATLEEAILLSIRGLPATEPAEWLPSLSKRFAPFEPWIAAPGTCVLRFESLRGDGLRGELARIVDHYAARTSEGVDREATVERLAAGIAPEKSHTFRKGRGGGWREAFTLACRQAFKEEAGDLLVRLGYEQDHDW